MININYSKPLQIVPFLVLLFLVFGCIEDNVPSGIEVDLSAQKAVYILNEGNFLSANASVTVYLPETGEVIPEFYLRANGAPLGDVAQSIAFSGEKAFLVVNNSQYVSVIDRFTGKYLGEINGLVSPRFLTFFEGKTFLSDLFSESISVIDANELSVLREIDISNGNFNFSQHNAEQMAVANGRLFAASWSFDNTVLVIDPGTETVVEKIRVGIQPQSLAVDKNENLWVLCDGGFAGNAFGFEPSSLFRINTQNLRIGAIYFLRQSDSQAGSLAISPARDSLYFLQGGIWKMSVDALEPPVSAFIPPDERLFYRLSVDPENGELYATDAIDFQQPGLVYRYAADGTLLEVIGAGIIPGFVGFSFPAAQ